MASNPIHGIDLEPVEERIADLRRKVEHLMEERVTPAVSRAAGRAQDFAGHVSHTAQKEADTVASLVKERPFTAILMAAGTGYLLARLLGR
ncbi:hypothetical protein IBL26_20380 [Roseomonas aerophila]|uniref:DUF883 domain-containing protein n=1 Tax=Teichococcus aerophilus TaxID=1224513 RepID=A0ABR7RS89_9PROT|nr:hypothetical protein [Pseudoroseomonas aerophila]MBC9209213.1 hypothetical protein [Pseudoroseomonas aerophila]